MCATGGTVGPVWTGGGNYEPRLLANCYRSCFAIARECGLHTIAFPAISCGVYRFPIYRAVAIAVEETLAELQSNEALEKVIFACFGNEVLEAYQQALK